MPLASSVPRPPHPRQAQGQLTSSLQPTRATVVTPTLVPALSPHCCCHFPGVGTDMGFFQKHFLCKIIPRNMFLETDS